LYLFIEGILRIISIFLDASLWGLKLVMGILGILAGIVVLNHPLLSAIAVPTYAVYVVGFLAVFEGVVGPIHAFKGGGSNAGISGVLTTIIGLILVFNPTFGVVALPLVLEALLAAGGIASVVMSFRLRSDPDATASI
jgi:uncharacterized membrane protein HdeD (DUF308 family)